MKRVKLLKKVEGKAPTTTESLAQQLAKAPVISEDLAKISEALEQLQPNLKYMGLGQWEEIIKAVYLASKGSDQAFHLADEWSKAWVFYDAEAMRVRWESCAKYPTGDINENSLFAMVVHKQEREHELDALAQLPPLDYEEQRRRAAKAMDFRVTALDEEITKRRKRAPKAAPAPKPPTIEELAKPAKDIIASADILDLFAKSISRTLAGEVGTAKLLYLCATSRLFSNPMNAAIKGLSAIGKSHLRDQVLAYVPPEDVVAFTTVTEKALLYLPDDLGHKILSMAEAVGGKDQELQDYLIRELISSGRIEHLVPTKDEDGRWVTQRVVKDGPIMFVTTTTKPNLHAENETRIISLETDDSHMQTRRVMEKVAEIEGLGQETIKLANWHSYQRWLAAGESRVKIPFALTLARHPKLYDKAVRMRRDVRQVLNAIKAHALLHREHRKRDKDGRIIATIREDYTTIHRLMANRLAQGAGTKLKPNDQRVLDTVNDLQPDKPDEGVKVSMLIRKLGLDQATISRRLSKLVALGYVENLNPGKGRTGRYRTTGRPASLEVLPTPEELSEARKGVRQGNARGRKMRA
jgi:hypothetical protein